MPELPEVQAVVDYIKDDLINEELIDVNPIWPKVLDNFTPKDIFKNRDLTIKDVSRRAKLIIIHFKDQIIAIHLRMTGKLYFMNESSIPKHTSALFQMKSGKILIFNDVRKFGRLYLYDNFDNINSRHGPEPLDSSFTSRELINILNSKKRNIKALLLDQSILSGLGNIYVDESLWASGIHPNSISNAIPDAKVDILHNSIQTILAKAISSKGTTIINFSVNGESGKYSEKLKVFGKDGKRCPKCNGEILKVRVTGRGTHICNKCQRKYIKP